MPREDFNRATVKLGDVDCENNASVGDISFNLQFTTNPS